jgi:predicted NBD/HSP70 family sugar kinase
LSKEQTKKRRHNRYLILRGLHFEGPLHRSELSRRYGIRKSSVTSIVSDLLKQGWVVEQEPRTPRSPVALTGRRYRVVCAAVRANYVLLGRVYLDGRLEPLGTYPMPADGSPRRVLDLLVDLFTKELRHESPSVLGVGVAVRGIVDPVRGVDIFAAHMPGWRNVPVREHLERELGHRVFVNNDVRCQLWSYAWFERGLSKYENILYLGMTEGLAGSAVVQGQMVMGHEYTAGEFGHVRAGDEGRVCRCGGLDCLETYASIPALAAALSLAGKGGESLAPKDLAEGVAREAAGDPRKAQIVEEVVERLARVLAGILAALDPQVLVLGTPHPAFAEYLRPILIRRLSAAGIRKFSPGQVLSADSDETTMLKGIAALAIEQAFRGEDVSLLGRP